MHRYMAPELYLSLLSGGPFLTSPASDAYAFGMTVLEMVTLQHPYPQFDSAHAAAQYAVRGEHPVRPQRMNELQPSAADALWELLQDLWAHDPQRRPSLDVAESRLRNILSFIPITPP